MAVRAAVRRRREGGGRRSVRVAVTGGGEETDADEGLVDDEWKRVPGGPFVARLIVQVAPARLRARYHRNCFNVAVPFDPIAMGQGWLAISAGRVLVNAVSSLVAGWGQGSGRL